MILARFLRVVSSSLFIVLGSACAAAGQTETATVSGLVTDRTAAAVSGAEVRLQSVERGTLTTTTTNDAGIYIFPSVHPGQYQISVQKQGFKQIDLLGLIVNVQDHIEQNFRLQLGSVAESVTVEAGALLINTTDAAVSTVVDRQFAENLPLNGRSFQTLIQLTPGVVLTTSTFSDSGQFSVNGQRPSSNYWMVDGVSANVGVGAVNPGDGIGGALGAFSVLGGTNSLVSVDALQEFRIQTSTFAPEFGRTPGGQISIVTRSGANQFHGTAFDYLRNDVFDANDWFADANSLPKAQERQNDFGGTFSGPVFKHRTFFFFSYEGLRLRLPQTQLTTVPDIASRQGATAPMQEFLNAYPLPNGNDVGAGLAEFNSSYSNQASLDAYSIRLDHKFNYALTLFGRYNYSPSTTIQRGVSFQSLNTLTHSSINIQTATIGSTWTLSPRLVNDLRFNYSKTDASSYNKLDTFGGGVPFASLPFPAPFTTANANLAFDIISLSNFYVTEGKAGQNLQRQINVVDNLTSQRGSHTFKVGLDYRRLSPTFNAPRYSQQPLFLDVASAASGNLGIGFVFAVQDADLLFHNLGAFAQDTWRIRPRLTLTYGLRWDVDVAPSSNRGFVAVSGYDLTNLTNLALAPTGTPPFHTSYANVAPRIGLAYQLHQNQEWQTVLRGGFGVFFDLATQEVGNTLYNYSFPFGAQNTIFGTGIGGTSTYPLSSTDAAPPAITPANLASSTLFAFDPNLKLPYTLQWNVALEQAIGRQQTITASYVGSAGRRLIQSFYVSQPNPSFANADLIGNSATSDYDALQLQFQRRLVHGLQVVASYTWAHSLDDASAGSIGNRSNTLVPSLNAKVNRGPSDFDIRNSFSGALSYDLPTPKAQRVLRVVLGGWSTQNVIQVRSATPIDVNYPNRYAIGGALVAVRPDVVSGVPLYLYGAQYPGGKAINNTPGAVPGGCPDGSPSVGPFCPPPINATTHEPDGQGTLGRNALRGFGAAQWDFAVHRTFPIRESLSLQFRAEMFNALNHPNFGSPVGSLSNRPQFGLSTQMLGQSLSGGNVGGGAFSPLYQLGGPRSIQLALKLTF